jgi:hypothetical protein
MQGVEIFQGNYVVLIEYVTKQSGMAYHDNQNGVIMVLEVVPQSFNTCIQLVGLSRVPNTVHYDGSAG